MERYLLKNEHGQDHVSVAYRGEGLLRHPLFNKGTAFTRAERAAFGLEGLLPDAVSSMEQQARRAYANVVRKPDPLERYIGLAALQDRNEHLFHRVLLDHIEEFLPIVYTPTVGQACREFSHIFRRGRGLWITPAHQGRIYQVLAGAPHPDVRLIVVTDNERVLGIGDQGAGGMALPIGKLALYTAAGGLHPAQVLPISLDFGTDNPELLDDELYLGWRWPRLKGSDYDALVEEFVHAVKRRFPRAMLQWEDLKQTNAFRLLDRHQRQLPSFNDDIQGTGATALAGILGAQKITGRRFADERIVILGAGKAGIGVARILRDSLYRAELRGDELFERIAVLGRNGLLAEGGDITGSHKRPFAWPAHLAGRHGLAPGASLARVVRQLQPTVLIGACGAPCALSQEAIRAMAGAVQQPVVLVLSSRADRAEADPVDIVQWTDGRALVAAGSSVAPVTVAGETRRIGLANNVFVFPGVGLGAVVAKATQVTNGMFLAAAAALAEAVTADERSQGSLYPAVWRLREVAARVAAAVVRAARDEGVGLPLGNGDVERAVAREMWEPVYPAYDPIAPRSSDAFEDRATAAAAGSPG